MDDAARRTFSLKEPVHVCVVTLDEGSVSVVRPHEKTVSIGLPDLSHLYVDAVGKTLSIVMLGYRAGNRRRVERIDAETSEATSALVETLTREHPEIDLRRLDRVAAFAKMGARDANRIGLFALTAALVVVALAISGSSIARLRYFRTVAVDARAATERHDCGHVHPAPPEGAGCVPAHLALRVSAGAESDPSLAAAREFSGGRHFDDADHILIVDDGAAFTVPKGVCAVYFEEPVVVLNPALTPAYDLRRLGLWLLAALSLSALAAWATRLRRSRVLQRGTQAGPYR